MAITLVTLSGTVADLVGDVVLDDNTNNPNRRVKVVVDSNAPDDYIADLDNNVMRLGTATVTPAADGTWSFADLIATGSADTNLDDSANLQYTVTIDYPRASDRQRIRESFGPFALTATSDITDLVAEQAVDVAYSSALLAEMEAIRDSQVDLSGISTSDGVVEALVKNTGGAGPLTSAALAAAIDARVAAVDVKRYGATGDGSTDDYTAITSALTAASALGADVYVPPGTYMVGTRIEIPSGVTLRGAGMSATTIKATAGVTATSVVCLRGATDVGLEDVTVEHNNAGSRIGVNTELPSTATVAVRHRIRRVRITKATNNAYRCNNPVKDFEFTDNLIDDCTIGMSMQPPNASSSTGLRIERNTVRGLTGTSSPCGIQVYGNTNYMYADVSVSGNHVLDCHASTIPIEVGRTVRLTISDNTIGGPASRGISTGNNTDVTFSGNVISDQSTYAFEYANTARGTVVGNVAKNCKQFLYDTAGGSTDLTVVGNTIIGTGLSSTASNTYHVQTSTSFSNVLVAGNLVRSMDYISGFLRATSSSTNVVVRDNFTISDTTNSPAMHYNIAGTGVSLQGNHIRITRNLAAGDNDARVILLTQGSLSGASVTGNEIVFTGTTAGATGVVGIGTANAGAGTMPTSRLVANRVVGGIVAFRADVTSADFVIDGNDGRLCTTEFSNINAGVIVRSTARVTEGTAAPSSGTWLRGDICWNIAPSASGAPGWMCVTGGSPGTWKAMANLAA